MSSTPIHFRLEFTHQPVIIVNINLPYTELQHVQYNIISRHHFNSGDFLKLRKFILPYNNIQKHAFKTFK